MLDRVKELPGGKLFLGILRDADVVAVDGNFVCLGFDERHSFHRAGAERPQNVELLRMALESVLGSKLGVKVTVAQSEEAVPTPEPATAAEPPPPAEEGDLLKDVLDTFGGRVLEDVDDENYNPWKES